MSELKIRFFKEKVLEQELLFPNNNENMTNFSNLQFKRAF